MLHPTMPFCLLYFSVLLLLLLLYGSLLEQQVFRIFTMVNFSSFFVQHDVHFILKSHLHACISAQRFLLDSFYLILWVHRHQIGGYYSERETICVLIQGRTEPIIFTLDRTSSIASGKDVIDLPLCGLYCSTFFIIIIIIGDDIVVRANFKFVAIGPTYQLLR